MSDCCLQVKKYLPKEFNILEQYTQSLPGSNMSPASPFGGFVINLNVSTSLHRDWSDHLICVVTVVSNCEGGELILVELGLVIKLRSGDTVIFPSHLITHLNMHFRGLRASIVCHSDKFSQQWVENRNNWQMHSNFSSS